MDVNQALRRHALNPVDFSLKKVTVDGIEYMVFGGDQAFLKDTPTSMPVYSKDNEFYSLESLICFLEHQNENHGVYVKQAAASNVRAITRIDRKFVKNYLDGHDGGSATMGISLKRLTGKDEQPDEGQSEAKKPRMDSEGGVQMVTTTKNKEPSVPLDAPESAPPGLNVQKMLSEDKTQVDGPPGLSKTTGSNGAPKAQKASGSNTSTKEHEPSESSRSDGGSDGPLESSGPREKSDEAAGVDGQPGCSGGSSEATVSKKGQPLEDN